MALNSIEELLEDFKLGKPVILMDDEDRENEGDLIVAAELVTPEIINFMAREGRGLICLTLTGERCDYLGLPQMVSHNGAGFATPFTVAIEAAEGVTTGISAADRARTIKVAVDSKSKPEDLVQPGHIFPLRAQPGGVLSRAGHTEAGCDLARLAGLTPSSAIVEIMNEDGTMSRRPELEAFAQEHGIKIGTIADLIQYRIVHEHTVERIGHEQIETRYGTFDMALYKDAVHGNTHMALSKGAIDADQPLLVRVHVSDPVRDLLGARRPDSTSWAIHDALEEVSKEGQGVVVLLNTEDGLSLEDSLGKFFDTRKQRLSPGQDGSGAYLTIGTGSQILRDLGVGKMRLLSTPFKFSAISGFGLEIVEIIPFKA